MSNQIKHDLETERELSSIREMLATLASGEDMRGTLARIVRGACELLEADDGTIGLVDASVKGVRIEAGYRMPEDEIGTVTPFGVGITGQVLQKSSPVIVDRYGDIETRTRTDLDQNAVLGVPIVWEGRTIGVFGLGKAPPGRFTETDARRLLMFAGYAAIVIRHAQLDRQTKNALRELQVLYRTSRSISSAMEIDEVVAAYLDQVAAWGRFSCSLVLYEFDEAGNKEWIVVRGQWSSENGLSLTPWRLRHSVDPLDAVLDSGNEVMISDVFADPRTSEELRSIQRESGRPALAMIPIMVRNRRVGTVVLAHHEAREWERCELEPFRVTANLLASAVESRREHWTAVARGRRLLVIEERQRIARELHDSVSQTLFGVLLLAQSAAEDASGSTRGKLNRLIEVSQRALGDMREIVRELRPETDSSEEHPIDRSSLIDLRNLGLIGALRQACLAAPAAGVEVSFQADDYEDQDGDLEFALLRIGQEAISNSFRHSRGKRIEVDLRVVEGFVELTVQDNGRGFDPSIPGADGFGLTSMRDRAAACGGTLEVVSSPGNGTRIHACLSRTA